MDENNEKKPDTEEHDKVVACKLCMAIGDSKEGDVVHLPESHAKTLVEAGLAAYAKADEVGQEEVQEESEEEEKPKEDEPAVIANSVKSLTEKLEHKMSEAIAKNQKLQPDLTIDNKVYAEVKRPLYKSNGEYIKGMIRAEIFGDRDAKQKVRAHEKEVAKSLLKQGFSEADLIEKAPPLGINETTTTQGGYLVNPQFSDDVYAIPHGQIDLQSLATTIDAKSNVLNQRFINESSLANGSIFGGLNVVATSEGGSFSSSLPAWSNVAFTLVKFGLFVYYTTEVLEDASYPVESELDEYANKAFVYGLNSQIIQGSSLEGILNNPGLVTVTHSSNDTAFHTTPATNLVYEDIAKIWSAVYPDCQTSAKGVWLFHPSLQQCVTQMTYTFNGTVPAWGLQYNAEQGLTGRGEGMDTPYRLMGKPAYPSWACSAPGLTGDILYIDFATVRNFRKPFRVEISKEFQFGTDQVAVRYVSRLDCRGVFRNAVTGPTGSQTFGAYVTRSSAGT